MQEKPKQYEKYSLFEGFPEHDEVRENEIPIKHTVFGLPLETLDSWSDSEEEVFWENYGDDYINFNSYEAIKAEKKCPFCKVDFVGLERSYEPPAGSWTLDHRFADYDRLIIKFCRNCKHWLGSVDLELRYHYLNSAVSIAREFENVIPVEVHSEVAQYLRRKPSFYNTISPTELEKFVASVFKANYRDALVKHVGGPGDQGVDVLLVTNDEAQWLIQVKRRGHKNSSEGFETIQKMAGTMLLKGVPNAMVVSTANRFSEAAKLSVKNYRKRGYKIELIDKGILDEMISKVLPESPWIDYLQSLCRNKIVTHDVAEHFRYILSDLE